MLKENAVGSLHSHGMLVKLTRALLRASPCKENNVLRAALSPGHILFSHAKGSVGGTSPNGQELTESGWAKSYDGLQPGCRCDCCLVSLILTSLAATPESVWGKGQMTNNQEDGPSISPTSFRLRCHLEACKDLCYRYPSV